MKKFQFNLSILTTMCVGMMFFRSLSTPGTMQDFCVSVHGIMLAICFLLNYATYKEMKND